MIREARGQGRTVEGPSGKEMAEVLAEVWAAVIEELERIDGEAGAGAGLRHQPNPQAVGVQRLEGGPPGAP